MVVGRWKVREGERLENKEEWIRRDNIKEDVGKYE